MSEEKKEYILLPEGTLSFPNFKEKRYNDSDVKKERGKYDCNIVFPANADLSELKKAIQSAVKAEWKDSAKALWDAGKIKSPLKVGAQCVDKAGNLYDGYESDSQVLAVSFYNPMVFMDQFKNKMASDSEQVAKSFYAGCQVVAAVTLSTYDNESKGLQCRLYAMMKSGEGTPLGGSKVGDPDDVFAGIAAQKASPVEETGSWDD